MLLARYAPAGVVVDESLKIIEFRGETAAYLETRTGMRGWGCSGWRGRGCCTTCAGRSRRLARPERRSRRQDVPLREGRKLRRVDVEAIPLAGAR